MLTETLTEEQLDVASIGLSSQPLKEDLLANLLPRGKGNILREREVYTYRPNPNANLFYTIPENPGSIYDVIATFVIEGNQHKASPISLN